MTRMVQTHTLNPTFARPFAVHALTPTFCPECCTVVTHPHIKLSVEVMYSHNSEVPLSLTLTCTHTHTRTHSLKEQSNVFINSHVLSSPESCDKTGISFIFVFQKQHPVRHMHFTEVLKILKAGCRVNGCAAIHMGCTWC